MSPYDEGRDAGRLRLAQSINPNPQCSIAAIDWYRGWFREMSVHRRNASKPAPGNSAMVLPLPVMTGEQIDLLCRREGLALAHLGRERFVLVPNAKRPLTPLRIVPHPESA